MPSRLWITYAWADDDEGDFRYLVSRLAAGGVDAVYDKIALIPGQRLWDQIAERIADESLAAWAYLLTPRSITSQPCQEELGYALDRALRGRGHDFPLIGLLHEVDIADVPIALRIRLCVSLASPDWVEEVNAGLERRAPHQQPQDIGNLHVVVHHPYAGDANLHAVEFRPRFGELRYWRIAYPAEVTLVQRGTGPARGAGLSTVLTDYVQGIVELRSREMRFVGSGDAITPGTSAYVAFSRMPDLLAFGLAVSPSAVPSEWKLISIGL